MVGLQVGLAGGHQYPPISNHLVCFLQSILILEWKKEVISMDFIIGFPRTSKQHDSIMVVVDRLSKVDDFIVVKYTNSASEVA